MIEDYINKIICGDCLWLVLCGLIIVGFIWWLFTHRQIENRYWESLMNEPWHGADWYK